MNPNAGRDPNYTANPNAMYQQFYGQQPPQQQGYPQQQFPPQGFANGPPQAQQYQQFTQQNFQQQQYAGGYDANGLAHQLQNQHLSAGGRAPGSPQRPRTSGSTQQASGSLNNDYVIFNRDDSMFSSSTKERAKALKLKVELHYNQSVAHAVERNQRSACPVANSRISANAI
jgi:protein-serine/threonine kinase